MCTHVMKIGILFRSPAAALTSTTTPEVQIASVTSAEFGIEIISLATESAVRTTPDTALRELVVALQR